MQVNAALNPIKFYNSTQMIASTSDIIDIFVCVQIFKLMDIQLL